MLAIRNSTCQLEMQSRSAVELIDDYLGLFLGHLSCVLQTGVIIFYQQTPIMFKKKQSQINIKSPMRPYSPLRNKSPLRVLPSPRNLSPMKNTFRSITTKTQRRQLIQEQKQQIVSPRNFQNNFQPNFENLANNNEARSHNELRNHNEARYESNHRFPAAKFGIGTQFTNDMSYFSNYSNISKDKQTMKQSKRLFTKCIAEMTTQKNKVCAERPNNSENTSLVQNSKQVTSGSKLKHPQHGPATSFKALKIQMIESVTPFDKKHSTVEKKNMDSDNTQRQQKAKEFMTQQPKRQQIIELINQSFSNATLSKTCQQQLSKKTVQLQQKPVNLQQKPVNLQQKPVNLQQKAKLMESLYVEEESDYRDFDMIMQKVQLQTHRQKMKEIEQSVKISIECNRESLTMDPFY